MTKLDELREYAEDPLNYNWTQHQAIFQWAADEIERLTEREVELLSLGQQAANRADDAERKIESLQAEINNLRASWEVSNKQWGRSVDEKDAEIEGIKEELENEQARGIHSCSPFCNRPLCVARRQIKYLQAEVEALREKLKKIRQCALPDPYDERDISSEWLIKIVMEQTNE